MYRNYAHDIEGLRGLPAIPVERQIRAARKAIAAQVRHGTQAPADAQARKAA
jgi:hypothetical protein